MLLLLLMTILNLPHHLALIGRILLLLLVCVGRVPIGCEALPGATRGKLLIHRPMVLRVGRDMLLPIAASLPIGTQRLIWQQQQQTAFTDTDS